MKPPDLSPQSHLEAKAMDLPPVGKIGRMYLAVAGKAVDQGIIRSIVAAGGVEIGIPLAVVLNADLAAIAALPFPALAGRRRKVELDIIIPGMAFFAVLQTGRRVRRLAI